MMREPYQTTHHSDPFNACSKDGFHQKDRGADSSNLARYSSRNPSITDDLSGGPIRMGIAQIAKTTGLTRQTVYRIKDDPAACQAMLTAWNL